ERNRLHDLLNIRRYADAAVAAFGPGFLFRDGHRKVQIHGIVRLDFRTNAIFKRRHDLTARGVVFRICREYEDNIERESKGVSLYLDVALLHDIEQANL